MTATESEGTPVEAELVEPFSKEWCVQVIEIWNEVVVPNLVDPDNYNYVVEFGATDTGAVCQLKADHGQIITWDPGKGYNDDDCDFILWAKSEHWRSVAEGKLDPVGAVASKRIHMRKGPMPVVIKEADPFKKLLVGFGRIPTAW
jgi:putative sterol carrier protein